MDSTTKKCPVCNAELKPDDAFCQACGAKVDSTPASASSVAVPAAAPAAAAVPSMPKPAAAAAAAAPATAAVASAVPQPSATVTTTVPASSQQATSPAPAATVSQPVQAPASVASVIPPTPSQAPAAGAPQPAQNPAPVASQPPFSSQQPSAMPGGYSAPSQGTAPTGYSAPSQPTTGYSAPVQAPAGYGAPQPPNGGYGSPAPGAPGVPPTYPPQGNGYGAPQGQPGPYGSFPPPPPPKKKNNALVAVIIVVAVLLVAGGIGIFVIMGKNAEKERIRQEQIGLDTEYSELVATITSGTTPRQVARNRDQLDSFMLRSPDRVEVDLETLVVVCEDYEAASKDQEATFTDMLASLDVLSMSTNADIAACANVLKDAVNKDYDLYLMNGTSNPSVSMPRPSSSGGSQGDPFAGEFPYRLLSNEIDIIVEDGEPMFSLSFENLSDKTIVYMEIWVFVYDTSANRLDGELEWVTDRPNLAAGESYTPENNGYFEFYTVDGNAVALGLPFINYIEYSDGSTWGITYFDGDDDSVLDQVMEQMDRVHAAADEAAKSRLLSESIIITKRRNYILNSVLTNAA